MWRKPVSVFVYRNIKEADVKCGYLLSVFLIFISFLLVLGMESNRFT